MPEEFQKPLYSRRRPKRTGYATRRIYRHHFYKVLSAIVLLPAQILAILCKRFSWDLHARFWCIMSARCQNIRGSGARFFPHTHTGNEREKKWISEPCPCEKRERSDCSRLARDFFLSFGQFSWFVQLQAVGLPIPPPHFSPPSIPQPPSTPLCPSYSW